MYVNNQNIQGVPARGGEERETERGNRKRRNTGEVIYGRLCGVKGTSWRKTKRTRQERRGGKKSSPNCPSFHFQNGVFSQPTLQRALPPCDAMETEACGAREAGGRTKNQKVKTLFERQADNSLTFQLIQTTLILRLRLRPCPCPCHGRGRYRCVGPRGGWRSARWLAA